MVTKTKIKDTKALQTPDGKTNTVATKIDEFDLKDLIQYCKSEYDDAVDARYTFINKQLKWYKKRYGIRAKTVFPWPGASNQHLPLQDKTVRKFKPDFVNVIYNALPMVNMTNFGGDDEAQMNELSNKAAWHMDWLLRERMGIFPDLMITADITLSKGFSLMKVIYEVIYEPICTRIARSVIEEKVPGVFDPQRKDELISLIAEILEANPSSMTDEIRCSEAADALILGAEYVDVTTMLIVYDAPRLIPLQPYDVVVPKDTVSIFDLEKARWIDNPFYMSAEDLIMASEGKDAKYDREVVKEILGKSDDDIKINKQWYKVKNADDSKKNKVTNKNDIELQSELREGIFGPEDDCYLIHELCLWYDSDGDNIPERHVMDYYDGYLDQPLRFIRYNLKLNTWNYFKIPYEIVDNRHLGPRGLIEILDPLATGLNIQYNQMINRNTIETAMNYWYVPDKVNEENIDFVFNRGIPVEDGNSIGMLETRMGTQNTFMANQQMLKAWAEEDVASSDASTASINNPMGTSGSRTKYELQMVAGQNQPVKNMDLMIFMYAWKGIFQAVWSLWNQFGPLEEISFKMQDQMTRMKRDELTGKYNIAPNGRIGAQDPVLEAQKAVARMQMHAGDIYYNQYELRYDAQMKDDPRLVKRLLQPKEVVAQLLAAQARLQQQGQEVGAKVGKTTQNITGKQSNAPGGNK